MCAGEELGDAGCRVREAAGMENGGFVGPHLMMMTVGYSSVSTSSMVIMSVAVNWPSARGVISDIGTRFFGKWVPQACQVLLHLTGRYLF